MTILSAQSIRKACSDTTVPLIKPFVDRGVSPGGKTFGLSAASYDLRLAKEVTLFAKGFVLASVMEYITMPDNLAATIRDKSGWARAGLAVQNTHVNPGWRGYLTLELNSHVDNWLIIPAGEPIAQIVFEILDAPTEQPYRGRYQDHPNVPMR
jgi:dCTP deaminase